MLWNKHDVTETPSIFVCNNTDVNTFFCVCAENPEIQVTHHLIHRAVCLCESWLEDMVFPLNDVIKVEKKI